MNFIEQMIEQSPRGAREVKRARLRVGVTEQILDQMQRKSISKTELASRIGVSRSAVTQALSGDRNMSLNTLADIADALGLQAAVSLHSGERAAKIVKGGIIHIQSSFATGGHSSGSSTWAHSFAITRSAVGGRVVVQAEVARGPQTLNVIDVPLERV